MRCVACNEPLSSLEMGRKSPVTGEDYLLCTKDLREAGLLVTAEENPIAEEDVYVDISGMTEEDFKT